MHNKWHATTITSEAIKTGTITTFILTICYLVNPVLSADQLKQNPEELLSNRLVCT